MSDDHTSAATADDRDDVENKDKRTGCLVIGALVLLLLILGNLGSDDDEQQDDQHVVAGESTPTLTTRSSVATPQATEEETADAGVASPTATKAPALTPTPTPSVDELKLAYRDDLDVRDLDRVPDQYQGELVYFEGEVFNFFTQRRGLFSSEEDMYVQVRISWPGAGRFDRKTVAIRTDEATVDGVYEGDSIAVWGAVDGTVRGRNALGGQITQARINADFIEKIDVESAEAQTAQSPADDDAADEANSYERKVASLGDTISFRDGIELTVDRYEAGVRHDFWEASEGMMYVAANIHACVDSAANESMPLRPGDFEVVMEDDSRISRSHLDAREPSLSRTDLLPGDCVRGWLTFEIEIDSAVREIRYERQTWSETHVIGQWEVDPESE